MATKAKTEQAAEAVVQEQAPESVYTAETLAEHHKTFGVRREIVVVALRLAGKETATLREAQKIIDNFKNREVK